LPAPDRDALLWKLARLFRVDPHGFTDGMPAAWAEAVTADARRLLNGRAPS
jgi:hypothetical protein